MDTRVCAVIKKSCQFIGCILSVNPLNFSKSGVPSIWIHHTQWFTVKYSVVDQHVITRRENKLIVIHSVSARISSYFFSLNYHAASHFVIIMTYFSSTRFCYKQSSENPSLCSDSWKWFSTGAWLVKLNFIIWSFILNDHQDNWL